VPVITGTLLKLKNRKAIMKYYLLLASAVAIVSTTAMTSFRFATTAVLASERTTDHSQTSKTEPSLFAEGIISTGEMELNAAFTPDGKTLYFTKRTPRPLLWVIVVSHFRAGKWTPPEVAEFSGQYSDFDPIISPDGNKLYFCSNRPVDGQPRQDFDIWVVDKMESGKWSAPNHLPAPVNTKAQEFYPSVTTAGTLYFSSTRDGGKGRGDIWRARLVDGKYAEPENLGESINTQFSEGDPFIAPDESYLIFVSYGRPEGLGDGDLYISFRRDDQWTKAVNMGPGINSSALDFCPVVAPDGKNFFFTSERSFADKPLEQRMTSQVWQKRLNSPGNGLGDIYRVDISVVNALRR
jgi:Tol biopolymer transport system component